jgi:hypothetical protein
MDPNNAIIRLCVEGMELEIKGQIEEAAKLFTVAWDRSSDDFERCIAAHYVARHQNVAAEALRWNQESLRYGKASDHPSVREFYPSLYLNLGKSHEDMGNRGEARKFYELAAQRANLLPENAYANAVRDGIARGLQRVANDTSDSAMSLTGP